MLLTQGEKEGWLTAHCSTVMVVTPYDNVTTMMHEAASGGGKSELLEHAHREEDGRLLLGEHPHRRAPLPGDPALPVSSIRLPMIWRFATPHSRPGQES